MFKHSKISIAITGFLILVIGCNDKNPGSAYDQILSAPPYEALTDSIRLDPKNPELYFRRAVLLNQNDLPGPALDDFKTAWAGRKEEKYAMGISTILMENRPDSAIRFLQQAIKEVPNSFLLKLRLARGFEQTNNTDEALRICEQLLQINPVQVDVLKMKSSLLDKKGKPSEAISILEKAYSLVPYDIELNYVLALKYAESRNPRVLRLCDSLIKKDSMGTHAEPFYYKGIYYINVKDRQEALKNFNQAIATDYYFLDAYIEKGAILYEQKKFNEALAVFGLANKISATFPDAYYWIGKCQEALGQKTEAKLNYQRAYGLDKSFIKAKEAAERI